MMGKDICVGDHKVTIATARDTLVCSLFIPYHKNSFHRENSSLGSHVVDCNNNTPMKTIIFLFLVLLVSLI